MLNYCLCCSKSQMSSKESMDSEFFDNVSKNHHEHPSRKYWMSKVTIEIILDN